MKQLLLLLAFFVHSNTFPMCTNGLTPLMEANDAFTCDRGCPLGFTCEYQDPYYTMSKAICCPNMTALQQIYGDEEHSEPIWDLKDVATLSVGLQPITESTTQNADLSNANPSNEINYEETTMESVTEAIISPSSETSTESPEETTVEHVGTRTEDTMKIISPTEKISTISEEERKSIAEMDKSLNQLESIQEATVSQNNTELEGSGEAEAIKLPSTASPKSCARQKYSITCHNGTIHTQATIRWWRNVETGECEYYPFGYCPGDRIIESVTIRAKAQCEQHCAKTSLDSIKNRQDQSEEMAVLESTTTKIETETSDDLSSSLSQPIRVYPTTLANPISAVEGQEHLEQQLTAEEKVIGGTVESDKEPPLTAEMPSKDLQNQTSESPKIAIEDSMSEHKSETFSSNSSATIEVDLTSEKQVQPPLSEVQEKVLAESQLSEMVEHGTGMESTKFENEVTIGAKENGIFEHKAVPVIQTKEQLAVGKESKEGIITKGEVTDKVKVACSSTSYRFACENGHPSQFVYRWELVDGVCKSFPYGYCYGEFNHPHPRTQAECLFYCSSKSNRIFAL